MCIRDRSREVQVIMVGISGLSLRVGAVDVTAFINSVWTAEQHPLPTSQFFFARKCTSAAAIAAEESVRAVTASAASGCAAISLHMLALCCSAAGNRCCSAGGIGCSGRGGQLTRRQVKLVQGKSHVSDCIVVLQRGFHSLPPYYLQA